MDLVTCPSCQFTFSPTPGKAVKCPACMTLIAPATAVTTRPAPKPASKAPPPLPPRTGKPAPKPRRNYDEDDEAPAGSRGLGLFIGGAILLLVVGLGGGILIARSMSQQAPVIPQVAKVKPPEVIPEVLIPKVAPPPVVDPIPEPVDPNPVEPKVGPKIEVPDPLPKKTPQVRPVEPIEPPPFKEDPPLKVTKLVVRDVDGVTPQKVDDAVKKGVAYLIGTSNQWLKNDQFPLGYAALGGLTLLECKVPATHPVVRQAADTVRRLAPGNDKTYEVSLSLLFLDRIGDPRDRGLIQTLGARLVAGQQASGGYTYGLGPLLTPAENTQLLHFLRFTRPPVAAAPIGITLEDKLPDKGPGDVFDPFAAGGKLLTDPIDPRAEKVVAPDDNGGTLVSMPPKVLPKSRLTAEVGTIRLPVGGGAVTNPTSLSPRVQRVPAVINQGREKDQMILTLNDGIPSDHSNLQFAVLGLWAARRHGVVSDRALLLAEARMRKVQRSDGYWNYESDNSPKSSMICAGVFALALGNAIHTEGFAASISKDAHIALAMERLGNVIGDPHPSIERANDLAPTYYLWSVERVAVMLNAPTIGGKDWYGWGAQILLRRQDVQGSWSQGGFTGATPHIDTSFALLFLVRSNLVQEVTEQIRLQMPLGEERP